MPSSNSPRDDGVPDSANSTENPFVRFRNNVDNHVGSVLQGIIGLPTILSRAPNSDNGRWAGLEGDSQRTQDDSRWQNPQSSAAENTSDGEVEIPVKKFQGRSPGGDDAFGPSHHDEDDYDIFSAFDDYIIERIKRSTRGHPWLELQPGDKFRWRYESSDHGVQEGMQQRLHACLIQARTTRGGVEPSEFPHKSVVPYLLFSSYSPLNMTDMPPLRPNDDPWGWDKDQFTYCDAFEDLLRESAGKPMRDISGSPLERMIDSIHKIKPDWPGPRYGLFPGAVTRMSLADIGMMWMGSLVDENILQEDPMPEQVHFNPWFGEIRTMTPSPIAVLLRTFQSHMQQYGLSQSHLEETEQDMYDRFFAAGSEPAGDGERVGGIVHQLLARLESEGQGIRDVFAGTDTTKRSEVSEQPSSSTTHVESSRASGLGSPAGATSTSVPSSERVVSSSTSTTQHTDQDGTVRTTIVVEKRFEDGRKSVSETSHIQAPSGEKQVRRTGDVGRVDSEPGKDNGRGEGGKKGGWFWN
ncbi:hypothetical protein VE01_05353 [Pseudogymnoascus verrucosus]|uniref:Uncharacterized protein n=1 Tax=Pseudogymnoascus verrucosus TaxID=342668 RepID=A0A1B8GKY1_9PEZI|nr:uncharacterized protein VE01_05353 [Pseudogymnoascus verrucosus]OBT96500.1 hypothetical protein VE01_05353 [Pseudogymnoascus verrucosus]